MKLGIVAALLAGAWLAAAPAMAVTITSTFDTDSEGWDVGNIDSTAAPFDAGGAPYVATGGNPDGYIFTNDTQGTIAFLAPTAFTGALGQSNGGQISFDIYDGDGNDAVNYPAVVIYGNGTSIGYNHVPPGTTFGSFAIQLNAAGWTDYVGGGNSGSTPVTEAEFDGVLANATSLAILADWHSGGDSTGLDNVTLSSPAAAVPEPASWAMMLAGFGLTGAAMRRRRAAIRFA